MAADTDALELGDARSRLYDVLEADDRPAVETYRRLLSIGRRYLGVENAHLKEVPGPNGAGARVSVASGDTSWIAGDTELDDPGFCRLTVERDDAFAIADATDGHEDNPGYADHGVACYLAARVIVDGEVYGTVCFVSATPRGRSFDEQEQLFVELLGQILGRQLEREHHTEALAESRSKYASLIEASPDPVFLLDTESRTVVEANDTAAALTGYAKSDLEGLSYAELWNAGGSASTSASAAGSDSGPPPGLVPAESVEWFTRGDGPRRTHPDGSAISLVRADDTEIPVEISASWVHVGDRDLLHAVVRDIRDERQRERRTEAIFDQTHQFTGLLSPDGTLLEANDTAMMACEADREDILGKPFPECPWWQTDEATREELRNAIERAADGEFVRYEVEVATVQGPMMIDFSIRPVTDDDGTVELLIPEGRDVSKRYERDRQLDVLARILRHNFRNKITVIKGYAAQLAATGTVGGDGRRGDAGDTDDSQRWAAQIEQAADNLSRQVEGYYETVSVLSDPPEPRPVRLSSVVSSLAADARDRVPEATLSVSVPAEAWIRAVPSIDGALAELIDNAVTHAAPSPTVEVTASVTDTTVSVTVADDGPGLPAEEAAVLTGDQSSSPLGHSTGIGLWQTYWLCDLSGAEIDVDVGGATDGGTTITIEFARADPARSA